MCRQYANVPALREYGRRSWTHAPRAGVASRRPAAAARRPPPVPRDRLGSLLLAAQVLDLAQQRCDDAIDCLIHHSGGDSHSHMRQGVRELLLAEPPRQEPLAARAPQRAHHARLRRLPCVRRSGAVAQPLDAHWAAASASLALPSFRVSLHPSPTDPTGCATGDAARGSTSSTREPASDSCADAVRPLPAR